MLLNLVVYLGHFDPNHGITSSTKVFENFVIFSTFLHLWYSQSKMASLQKITYKVEKMRVKYYSYNKIHTSAKMYINTDIMLKKNEKDKNVSKDTVNCKKVKRWFKGVTSYDIWNMLGFLIFNLKFLEIVNGHVIGQPFNNWTDQNSAKSCHHLL